MKRLSLLVVALAGCNQWIRPTPPPPHIRNNWEQRMAAVQVEMNCDPFEDGGRGHIGSGVMVSDWQVLTALHVVDCPAAIPTIHVTTRDGDRYMFAPEKEWRNVDVARIQMASGDHFPLRFTPPTLRESTTQALEPLYIQAAEPEFKEILGEASGWEYPMSGGGTTLSYSAPTEEGVSGSAGYDWDGELVSIHLGQTRTSGQYGARVTLEMIPN